MEKNDSEEQNSVSKVKRKCQDWLERCASLEITELNEKEVELTSETSSEITAISTTSSSNGIHIGDQIVRHNGEVPTSILESLKLPTHQCQNVVVSNSKNVMVGNVIKFEGDIVINQNVLQINDQIVSKQVFVDTAGLEELKILRRRMWLAQSPIKPPEHLSKPAKFVIISHTATEEADTIADNNWIVRLIQQFHIESRKWNDIAYNYLIGGDGNIYEGRGFGVVGAHTYHYNDVSVGISFIGCFINKLPSEAALHKARQLIECGVKIGAIHQDYILLAHCQCSAVESPGKALYEELKSWKNWDPTINSKNSYFHRQNVHLGEENGHESELEMP